ncbi:hypothetical protein [Streptomyces hydrogenans]|uniref:hypothetical protein n=1 Tax=Streptomyces hydrogenans TaxID=1873719 RepID=UPI0035D5C20E
MGGSGLEVITSAHIVELLCRYPEGVIVEAPSGWVHPMPDKGAAGETGRRVLFRRAFVTKTLEDSGWDIEAAVRILNELKAH